jgi:DEAD/DEAH box helicase domain-containing protein
VEGNFVVIDITNGKQDVLAEVDFSSAADTIYEGAIYLIQARPWQVERLDWEGRKAFVKETQADYYTDAIDYTKLKILDEFESEQQSSSRCARGEVHIVRRIPGYKKIRYYTHENIGYGKIHLPDQEMHTTSVWWQADPIQLIAAFPTRWQALDGFLGAGHALHFVAALLTMSERSDLGKAVGDSNATWFATVGADGRGSAKTITGDAVDINSANFIPTVFLYDKYPGGIGLSTPLFDMRADVVEQASKLIRSCACKYGCPSCIGPILASDEERHYSPKQAALEVLRLFGTK